MSDVFLPTLVGLTWGTTKAPRFNTKVQVSVNLSELRASFANAPVYDFTRTYDLLRDNATNNELRQLGGFFMARYGAWDSWLFQDLDDCTALLEPFGTGDSTTTQFQLKRAFGSFTEGVSNVANAPLIYANAVLQNTPSAYSVAANGLVTFTAAPASNIALTWSGTYYFRCRFKEDAQEYRQFMSRLWDSRTFEFKGSLGTRI